MLPSSAQISIRSVGSKENAVVKEAYLKDMSNKEIIESASWLIYANDYKYAWTVLTFLAGRIARGDEGPPHVEKVEVKNKKKETEAAWELWDDNVGEWAWDSSKACWVLWIWHDGDWKRIEERTILPAGARTSMYSREDN